MVCNTLRSKQPLQDGSLLTMMMMKSFAAAHRLPNSGSTWEKNLQQNVLIVTGFNARRENFVPLGKRNI